VHSQVQAKRTEYIKKNSVVPPTFGDETTSIELIVTEKTPATLTIDVAKQ